MVRDVPALIEFLSPEHDAAPGTAIFTGTPHGGVGMAQNPPLWLRDGDEGEHQSLKNRNADHPFAAIVAAVKPWKPRSTWYRIGTCQKWRITAPRPAARSRDNALVALTDLRKGETIKFAGSDYVFARGRPGKA